MRNQYTKELIRKVFIEMLNEKPLKQITIKDIVSECNINRNTFYYYYGDIYELLSEIFQNELEIAIEEYNNNLSWEEGFLFATKFALENKRAVYHVYHSLQREELENYIYNVAGNVMKNYVNNIDLDIKAKERDKNLIISFYQSALTTMVIKWISSGMKEEPEDIILRVGELFNGHIQESLKRSSEEE